MIPVIVSLVLGAAGGAAFARARSIQREEQLRDERDELALRVAKLERAPALPPAAGALTIPAQVSYREPDRSAVLTLPEDAEDFAMLEEAVSACLEEAVAMGEEPSEESLRDCVLTALFPDFQWPPVPGDPESARVLWLIVAHEARKELAARHYVGGEQGGDPAIGTNGGALSVSLTGEPVQSSYNLTRADEGTGTGSSALLNPRSRTRR